MSKTRSPKSNTHQSPYSQKIYENPNNNQYELQSKYKNYQNTQTHTHSLAYKNYTKVYDTNNQQNLIQQQYYNDRQQGRINGNIKLSGIDQCRLSPIINNNQYQYRNFSDRRINGNKSQDKKLNGNDFKRNMKGNWRNYIDPQINRIYQQLITKQFKNQINKQYSTPKARMNTERSKQSKQQQVNKNKNRKNSKNMQNGQEKQKQIKSNTPNSQQSNLSLHTKQQKQKKNTISIDNTPKNDTNINNVPPINFNNENGEQFYSENQINQNVSNKQYEDLRSKYQNRISVLEHQNNNLKDQLFYLRAAILAKYQERQPGSSKDKISIQKIK